MFAAVERAVSMTVFAIRHKTTNLFWWGRAPLGDVWGPSSRARRFQFITAAYAVGLFECRESPESWEVVPVLEAA